MNTESFSIIIVENQHLMRKGLSSTLSMHGFDVVAEVIDSKHILQTASKLTPNLILFSVNHPSLDDLKRINDLRKEIPSTLILALVTGEFRGQEQAARDAGAHIVLTKSVLTSELVNAIKKLKKLQPANYLSV
ncbi:MAG: response regulator transcription factor [Anaerolineales bacterium]|nr:response regulator transcription factor [Anaerolineales bacterium]